jgi:hypothetical protein
MTTTLDYISRIPDAEPPQADRSVNHRPRRRRLGALPVDRLVLPVLLMIVALAQGWNILRYPNLSDDEGTYLAQAWAVQHGVGLAHYTYWYDHPPLGWIQIAALAWVPADLLPQELAVAGGRLIMLPITVGSAALLYLIARRLTLPRWAAALAVLGYGLSPLAIFLQRHIYLDSIAIVWMLAAFALALSPRRHIWHHLAAGSCAAVSVLSKETMALTLPGVLVAVWQNSHPRTRLFSLVGFGCAVTLIGACYPLYAALNRELFPGEGHVSLVGALLFQMHERASSGSAFSAGSNTNQLLQAWLFYDPVLPVVGAVAVAVALAVRHLRAAALAGVLLVLMVLRPGGYVPAMYVVQALPFFALTTAGLVAVGVPAVLRHTARARFRLARASGPVGVAAAGALALLLLVPVWYGSNRRAWTADATSTYRSAVRYVREKVPDLPHTRIVADDAIWLDLVRAGCDPRQGAIWFYKLDLDPEVQAMLPNGWRDVDYIISTSAMRDVPEDLPTVDALLAHSRVVAAFGTGDELIEIRRITKEQP